MVNEVLHDYLQQLRRRMLHIPLRVQRRIVNEVLSTLEPDIRARRKGGLSVEAATQQAIQEFCPLDEALPHYGDEEGIIRRSTAEWVVHAPPVKRGRTVADAKKWGAAAAALAVVSLTVAVIALLPGDDGDGLGPETLPPDGVLHQWQFGGASGNITFVMSMPTASSLAMDADGTGCIELTMIAPGDAGGHEYSGCLHGSWQIPDPVAGDWLVVLHLDNYQGTLQALVA